MTLARHETEIVADPDNPTIEIIREFEAPPERVFRAWIDPDLFKQWIGPRAYVTRIETWDARTGGSWRYTILNDGEEQGRFYGSFHEVRPSERLVQTFTWEGAPDGVSLDITTFVDLGEGRTRIEQVSVVETKEIRDQILASGMEVGVIEGYEKLDELLARMA